MSGGYFHPCSHKLTLVMIVILSKFLNLMDLKFSEKSGHKLLFVWKPQIFEHQQYCCELDSTVFFCFNFKYLINLDFRVSNDCFHKTSKLCSMDLILMQVLNTAKVSVVLPEVVMIRNMEIFPLCKHGAQLFCISLFDTYIQHLLGVGSHTTIFMKLKAQCLLDLTEEPNLASRLPVTFN